MCVKRTKINMMLRIMCKEICSMCVLDKINSIAKDNLIDTIRWRFNQIDGAVVKYFLGTPGQTKNCNPKALSRAPKNFHLEH